MDLDIQDLITLFTMQKQKKGKCEHCGQNETVEHVIMECLNYEQERRFMMRQFEDIKEELNVIDTLHLGSEHI